MLDTDFAISQNITCSCFNFILLDIYLNLRWTVRTLFSVNVRVALGQMTEKYLIV